VGTSITLRSDRREGAKTARSTALVAMVLAPPLVGFMVDSWAPLLLIGASLGGGLLAFSFVSLRRWVGEVEALAFSDEGVAITRKGKTVELTWDELESAAFQSINTTPWLTLETREGGRHRLCLEDFDAEPRRAITEAVMSRIPDRTTSTESWTIANRIPVSTTARSVEKK